VKIFGYDRLLPGATLEKIKPLLEEEARHAWDLYKRGILRENYLRTDRPGAVVVLECADVDEARRLFADLPLVRAGLIEFDFIPVGPFTPWEGLFKEAAP
jgi:hypothetical protein